MKFVQNLSSCICIEGSSDIQGIIKTILKHMSGLEWACVPILFVPKVNIMCIPKPRNLFGRMPFCILAGSTALAAVRMAHLPCKSQGTALECGWVLTNVVILGEQEGGTG
jgi:hypothetical protein